MKRGLGCWRLGFAAGDWVWSVRLWALHKPRRGGGSVGGWSSQEGVRVLVYDFAGSWAIVVGY